MLRKLFTPFTSDSTFSYTQLGTTKIGASTDTDTDVSSYRASVRQFSNGETPEAKLNAIKAIWVSVFNLLLEADFTEIAGEHALNFIDTAESIRNFTTTEPLQGKTLLMCLMCANICYLATLKIDAAAIEGTLSRNTENGTNLRRLLEIINLVQQRETRRQTTEDPNILFELAHIHQAQRLSSYINFQRLLHPYFDSMSTRLKCIKTSMPKQESRFFSPGVPDWLSIIDAALVNITDKSRSGETVTAYETILNVLLYTKPPKDSPHFQAFKSMLEGLTLHEPLSARAAARPS